MKNMNKKGVSAVVATVLIVMITVAAVAIIWATIIPMIKSSAEEGLSCYDAQTDLSIEEGSYTCSNTTTGVIQIKRGSKAPITAIQILWGKNGETTSNETTDVPAENNKKVYFQTTGINATEVTIAPVITLGNTRKVCEPIQKVILKSCS